MVMVMAMVSNCKGTHTIVYDNKEIGRIESRFALNVPKKLSLLFQEIGEFDVIVTTMFVMMSQLFNDTNRSFPALFLLEECDGIQHQSFLS